MGKLVDLTGHRFGTLTVKGKAERKKKHDSVYWLCDCDCGNKNIPKNSQWLRSVNDDARCSRRCKLRKIGLHSEDLTGQKFGRLTFVKIDEERTRIERDNKRGKTYWICKCDCGNEISTRADHVKSGKIVSCGCYYEEFERTITTKDNEIIIDGDIIKIFSSNSDDIFIIDKEDYEKVKNYCWHSNMNGYAQAVVRGSDNKNVLMARIIMDCNDEKLEVDHINHDIKDNRKTNLRIVETIQNNWNVKTSHLSGISKNNITNKWEVKINYKLQRINLGKYNSYEEALDIRNKAEDVFFGEYKYKGE